MGLLSELRRKHRNSILNRFLLMTSFHALLTFIYFYYLFILWPLSPTASSVSWNRSCFVCSWLTYEIYSGGGPSTYVYWVVCYCVIVALCVRSVGHVFAYLYTLHDDLERQIDYEISLLPKCFPSGTVCHLEMHDTLNYIISSKFVAI